jgi:hypothetical protein
MSYEYLKNNFQTFTILILFVIITLSIIAIILLFLTYNNNDLIISDNDKNQKILKNLIENY